MGTFKAWLYGLGIGAGLMYFLDPQQGDRRKALVRDQLVRFRDESKDAVDVGVRDLRNRTRGLLAEGIAIVSNEGTPDYVMEERLRSRLGFLTRHPRAVQVSVREGTLHVDGDILADESEAFIAGLSRIRGVRNVQNNLRVHQEAGNISSLQGEGWMPGDTRGSVQWTPAARLVAGGGAVYLLLYGLVRGGFIGSLAKVGGLILGARAFTNLDYKTMTGQQSDFEAVRIRKSININAPVDEVYGLWSNFENFSRFMNNIEEIHDLGEGRSHWVVKGPAGAKVEFEAKMTQNVANEVVAWETTPDSMVKHRGQVRFKENKQGSGTTVNVNMAYTPPAGVAGHAVAKLFGKDPKSEMDADLARMKSLLEKGQTTASGQRVRREDVMPVTGQGSIEDVADETIRDLDESTLGGSAIGAADDTDDIMPVTGHSGMEDEADILSTDTDVPSDTLDEIDAGMIEDDEPGGTGQSRSRRDNDNMSGIGGGPLNTSDL